MVCSLGVMLCVVGVVLCVVFVSVCLVFCVQAKEEREVLTRAYEEYHS